MGDRKGIRPIKTGATYSKGSFPAQVEEETEDDRQTQLQRKNAVKTEVVVATWQKITELSSC